MRKVVFLFFISLITLSTFSQNDDSLFIRRLADEILLHSRAYENLKVLTKQIGGRLTASPQMIKAERWGLKAMQEAGADTAWWQACAVPYWVRGGKDAAYAVYGKAKKSLAVTALGNSYGSMKPLTTSVIEIKNFDDLEAKKDRVRGKIIFYNYPFNPTFIRTFLAYGDAVRYRGTGTAQAARYGASAVMVRSMTHSTDNYPHTGATTYNDSFAKIPAVAIGLHDADWLSTRLQKGNVVVTLHTHGRFLPDTTSHNVIGEIRGAVFPDEYITVGGHLDSWDLGEGAHDDGAGCVQTIEIVRAFKALGYQPKRTIRFVLFTNEENGVRGGSKYAEEAKAKGEKHIFALESDAGGFTPRGFSFMVTPAQFQKVLDWQPLLAPYGATEFIQGGGGTDIAPLNRTQETPIAGLYPDSQRYFDVHHARSDVFEAVNKRELELGAVNMAALLYLIDKYGL